MIVTSKTTQIELGDGQFTNVEHWGETGPFLVCVHGIASSRQDWKRTAEYFAPRFRVVAYDQRGHGDSAAVNGPMALERSLADLDAVVATLDGPIRGLLGHSWGGAVAVLGGRRIRCDRVIAIDPMIHQAAGAWASDFVDDLRDLFAIPPAKRPPAIREMFAGAAEVVREGKVHAMQSMRIETIEALGAENGADAGKWDLRETVRGYPKPLYLAVADQSDSVIFADDLAFIRANGGSNVTVEVYAGEGHTLQRSAFERFAAASERFLADG